MKLRQRNSFDPYRQIVVAKLCVDGYLCHVVPMLFRLPTPNEDPGNEVAICMGHGFDIHALTFMLQARDIIVIRS